MPCHPLLVELILHQCQSTAAVAFVPFCLPPPSISRLVPTLPISLYDCCLRAPAPALSASGGRARKSNATSVSPLTKSS